MKIVFLITRSDTIGGAHIHVRDIASRLIKEGHDVVVLIGGRGPFSDILNAAGIKTINLKYLRRAINPFFDTAALFEIRKTLKSLKPSLITIHSSKAGIIGRMAAVGTKIPVMFTVHGWSFTEGMSFIKRKVFFYLEKALVPLTDKIVCVSDYDKNLALNLNLTPKKYKLITIHNGVVDLKNFKNCTFSKGGSTFLSVARFDDQKDHALLLRAVRRVPGCCITLIGDGKNLKKMKLLSRQLGIRDRIHFKGEILADEKVFAEHCGYILISRWEGLPLSIMEAMRSGLPVLASDVGGCSEEVVNNENGFLVPAKDLNALVDKLSLLNADVKLRYKLGKKSREIYEKKFLFDRMYTHYLAIYRALSEK